MEINEARKYCEDFAEKYNLDFDDESQCGFGRPCVGLLDKSAGTYIEYNPLDPEYEYVEELYNEVFEDTAPVDAYHKHTCFAVLARNDDYDGAIIQLADWLRAIEKDHTIEIISTGEVCDANILMRVSEPDKVMKLTKRKK